MLCEVEIKPAENQIDREGARILKECQGARHQLHSLSAGRTLLSAGG